MIASPATARFLLWRAILQCAGAQWHSLAHLDVLLASDQGPATQQALDLIAEIQNSSNRRLTYSESLSVGRPASAHRTEDWGFLVAIAFLQLHFAEQRILLADRDGARANCQKFLYSLLTAAAHVLGEAFTSDEQELILDIGEHLPSRLTTQLRLRDAVRSGTLPSQLIFVLGMHRSGTSALSGMLCQSGFDPPQDLMPATANNPRGYWESLGIFSLNNEFLKQYNASWDTCSRLPRGWESLERTEIWRERMLQHLQIVFAGSERPVIKDPRFSILLRGLSPWLESGSLKPSMLLISRDPLEVARSLEKAEGIPYQIGIQLWLQHIFAAERSSRGFPRLHVTYEELLQNPQQCLQNCRRLLLSDGESSVQKSGADFITTELHRQQRVDWEKEMIHHTNDIKSTREIALALFRLLGEADVNMTQTITKIDILFSHWQLLSDQAVGGLKCQLLVEFSHPGLRRLSTKPQGEVFLDE
jgi:hypothetical protein